MSFFKRDNSCPLCLSSSLVLPLMVNHAHSKLQKRVVYSKAADIALHEVLEYIRDMRKNLRGKKQRSVAFLLDEFLAIHPDKLTPAKRTIYRHLKDKDTKSKAQEAADRQVLNPVEEATLVSFIQKLATCAFPLGHQRIMQHALEIARNRNPAREKMGESWFRHFKTWHSGQLTAAWTKNLDTTRAAAVNPPTITHYYDLLKATLLEHGFTPGEIYGFDESGFPFGGDGIRERVYGGDSSVQHKQSEGNRENVSVMVTICADGTYLTPTVIFKAKHFNSAWAEMETELKVK
jgi:hypothetical protein